MRNVQLPDPLYDEAAKQAERQGLSLEDFIADAVRQRLDDFEVPDSFFTPEIMAGIDEAAERAREGRNQTMAEVREEIVGWRQEWLRSHPA